MTPLPPTIAPKRDRLLALMRSYGSCAVAYSGGVDSAVVAKAAQLALGKWAIAVTGISASLAQGELEAAARLAQEIGIRHELLETNEISNAAYIANAPDRCFHCKTELYTQLAALAERLDVKEIVSGTNLDDLGDYRPGLAAAVAYGVRQPLAECEFTKSDVRALAAAWELRAADKPASPCLSSRVEYGVEVTPERLRMIDAAERLVRALGVEVCRVRCLAGDIARVEVPREAIAQLMEPAAHSRLAQEFGRLGFSAMKVDPEGFRSGRLNESLPVYQLQRMG